MNIWFVSKYRNSYVQSNSVYKYKVCQIYAKFMEIHLPCNTMNHQSLNVREVGFSFELAWNKDYNPYLFLH